jgi:putative membrane protein
MRSGRTIAFAIGVAFAVSFGVRGQTEEQTFVRQAVQGNIAELRLGELAVQRAENEAVRKFAETIRVDHQAALKRATNLAKSLKIEAPSETTTEAEGFYDGLSQLTGAQFDAAFVSHMITAHEAEIANYSRHANSDDDAVAAMIADALPKLKAHLSAAQALQRGAHSGH